MRILHVARLVGGLAVVSILGGCQLFGGLKFTNVSDTWLNVRYYVGPKDEDGQADAKRVLHRHHEALVRPGTSVNYRPPEDLVHVHVETVTPTWEPTGKEYWLELLTVTPIHLVASGQEDKIEFKAFEGEIAMIPERERKKGRFEYLSPTEMQARIQAERVAEVGPPQP